MITSAPWAKPSAQDGRQGWHPWPDEPAIREELIMGIEMGTMWVCTCCALDHANGECCADDTHGGDGRQPWSDVDHARYSVTAGLLLEEHSDECPNRMADAWVDECDCETREFSWSTCDGCGSSLAGTRHAHTLWRERQRFPTRTMPLP